MGLIQVDARGRSCPEPVLLTKKVLVQNPQVVEVICDSTAARDNVARLAGNSGYNVEITTDGEDYVLTLKK